MALGAPSEWLYNCGTISWTLTIAYDIYIGPIIGKIRSQLDYAEMRQKLSERYSAPPTQNHMGRSEPKEQDETLDLAQSDESDAYRSLSSTDDGTEADSDTVPRFYQSYQSRQHTMAAATR